MTSVKAMMNQNSFQKGRTPLLIKPKIKKLEAKLEWVMDNFEPCHACFVVK